MLNRCPDIARSVALSCAVLVQDSASTDSARARAAFVALASGSDAAALQCDADSSAPVPLRALTLYAGGTFGAPSVRGQMECRLAASTGSGSSGGAGGTAASVSVPVARGVLPMTTVATMWPAWEDALIFYPTGRVRSGRAGVTANLTFELLRAAVEYSSDASDAASASTSAATGRVTSACSSSSGSSSGGLSDAAGVNCSDIITATSPQSLLLQAALGNPTAVLAVAQTWSSQLPSAAPSASESSSSYTLSSFSVTLTAATVIVLRAAVVPGARAFGGNTTASLGLGACTVLAVSPDGAWLVLRTPDPSAVCSGPGPCGYVRFVVSSGGGIAPAGSANASGNAVSASQQAPSHLRSATLACPPFCPRVITAALAAGDEGIGPFNSGGADGTTTFVLARLPPVLASSVSGPLQQGFPTPLSTSVGVASTVGFYYSVACADTGIFTDPSSGACTNASDPASLRCAYGAGASCQDCPVGALCPGGFRE
jgi:hypothetical protein